MNRRACRIAAFLLGICAVLFLPNACQRAEESANDRPVERQPALEKETGMRSYAEKDGYRLYADGTSGVVQIRDASDDVLWSSIHEDIYPFINDEMYTDDLKSLLIVKTVDANSNADLIYSYKSSVSVGGLSVAAVDGGVKMLFDFPGEGDMFQIGVVFILESDGVLKAELLFDELSSYGQTEILTVSLMPCFGSAEDRDEGFLFIPDGGGALIEYDKSPSNAAPYDEPVFGRDPAYTANKGETYKKIIRLPVFGASRNGHAYLAVIENAAAYASIQAYQPNSRDSYSSLCPVFTFQPRDYYVIADKDYNARQIEIGSKKVVRSNPAVRYLFIEDDPQNFVSMAARYRSYLMDTCGLERLEAVDAAPLHIEAFGGSTEKKSLVGIPYQSYQAVTTFSDLQDILSRLDGGGVSNIKLTLYGFQKGGMLRKNAVKLDFDRHVGGNKEYRNLLDLARQLNATVYPVLDCINEYENKPSKSAKRMSGSYLDQSFEMTSTYDRYSNITWYLFSPAALKKNTDAFMKNYRTQPGEGLNLSAMGDLLYSDFNTQSIVLREENLDNYIDFFEQLKQTGTPVMAEGGNSYTLPYAGTILEAPLESTGYDIVTRSVPFYAVALHGLRDISGIPVNTADQLNSQYLRSVSVGYSLNFRITAQAPTALQKTPLYYLNGTEYALWEEDILRLYNRYKDVQKRLYNKLIVDYEESGGVSRTVYEDGTVVYVNYTGQTVRIQDTEIQGLSYTVAQ